MNNNELPISISAMQLSLLESEFVTNGRVSDDKPFDDRAEFIFTWADDYLGVRLVVNNERINYAAKPRGIRRAVTIMVTHRDTGRGLAMANTIICMRRDQTAVAHTARVAIDFDDIDFGAPYKVSVRDNNTGLEIAEKPVKFYRSYYDGRHVSDTYKPAFCGIAPDAGDDLHRAIKAGQRAAVTVKFGMAAPLYAKLPILPEAELRLHLPDGSIVQEFLHPSLGDIDDEGCQRVDFSTMVCIDDDNHGVCYAELLCLDWAVAGFVFSTDHDPIDGPWMAANMDTLEEPTPEEIAKRFAHDISLPGQPYEPADEVEDGDDAIDDFDRMIDDFLQSEQAAMMLEDGDPAPDSDDPGQDRPSERIEPSALDSLDSLTGLAAVKEKLRAYEQFVIFNKMRQDAGLPALDTPLHAMFCGSPGTGKTTVAKRMGSMLRQAGVLSKGHVVVKERATLLGKYYSVEETNTLKAIEEAQGGILFIDEAYQLYQPDDPRDPGKFVIEALMTALADESKRDWMLILAGYPDEMKRMFEMNPGLKSRIPESNIYVFDDFSEPELMEIAENYLQRSRYTLTTEARAALASRLSADYSARDKAFGNARHVLNMIQTEILPAMASRVVAANRRDAASLTQIQASDIPRPQSRPAAPRPQIGYR